jgi:ribosomal protein S18 acetylase RimI-like enzyme
LRPVSLSRAAAEEKGRRDDAELLPDGLATPGQLILRVEVDGQPVGWLWLALQNPRAEAGVGFIYDISIDEALRGRGYGRAAMRLAEEEARRPPRAGAPRLRAERDCSNVVLAPRLLGDVGADEKRALKARRALGSVRIPVEQVRNHGDELYPVPRGDQEWAAT